MAKNSIGELQAFVVDRLGLDAEAYLNDEGRYKDEGGILIKQVTPLKFLYEYGNQAEAECCYATEPGEGSGKFQDVKIECNCKLVTSSPTVMREILERRLNLSLS
ncbi:hypothetical protein A3J61_01080 [Candidatus Nomurabacteria bacterium RIFCSPHIGHO2_02_FULL_38_15]|uniref:Uncharacterized protein n=1 Tax=Candidatus Nomurabacteria bacterium RIFCSPHIGHO2_02_FULL_38_15 TaxID=1801752 RepID=A0A1F6VSL0_9BACT|nr:MAG: hypothetical protein A3J61_01080 [Candidatus Nomurabacteria bacterium RIFCSPHIGHO2_02_FULL_38_15]